MHLPTLVVAPLLLGVSVATPAEVQEEPEFGISFGIDSSNLVPENFTATDGLTYEMDPNASEEDEDYDSDDDDGDDDDNDDDDNDGEGGNAAGGPKKVRRGFKKPRGNGWKRKSSHQDKCRKTSYVGDTGPHAPTTGRCAAVRDWAASNKGRWNLKWDSITPGQYRSLVHSKKDGATTCHFAVYHDAWAVRIGNHDVREFVQESLNKYSRGYNGVWRVRSRGSADCDGDLVKDGSAELKWKLDSKV